MTRDRQRVLVVGVILLVNAAVILTGADGQIEGYVGGGICILGGILNIGFAFRDPWHEQKRISRQRAERSGE